MRRLRLLVPAVMLLAITGLATAAQATTVEQCQALITDLAAQTSTATLLGGNAEEDRAALQGKLTEASAKLAEGKFADAIQKLIDFRTKVEALAAAKPKISAESATILIAGANAAIACIEGLQATTT